ncbi:MAG: type I methionyl aminopeptidase [Candidatus Ancillula sp.]|jgi:methionyl aminopeptidase|nr:type I methionyl aminopeptidase [Candidatus Ancillula sp.]
MIEIRSKSEIEEMKPAGKFVAEVLQALNSTVKHGMNLLEIDEIVHSMIAKRGAKSCYVDYEPSFGVGPFGHYICTSVNDAVLHGKPFDYTLQRGDLLSLDFACSVNGWVADSAFSILIGEDEDPKLRTAEIDNLMQTTQEALQIGIDTAVVGNRVSDISASIGDFCSERGFLINTEFGGHGVGRIMHGDPHIPNDGVAGRGYKLRPGLVVAIEPWLLMTTDEIYIDEQDGWTIRSDDGSLGAHFEHTIAVTDAAPVILTAWD